MRGWLAVGAVHREPFSTANSLLTGKITGNFNDSGPPRSPFERNKPHFTVLWCGTRRFGNRELFRRNRQFLKTNRELFGIDQGRWIILFPRIDGVRLPASELPSAHY